MYEVKTKMQMVNSNIIINRCMKTYLVLVVEKDKYNVVFIWVLA